LASIQRRNDFDLLRLLAAYHVGQAVGFVGLPAVGFVAAAAGALGTASWVLVERPALRRKRSTIHRVGVDG
jgi:hypothetical protein